MNNNAKKWVQALRSGEYAQGKGRLRRDDTFCSLGVACDLHSKETGKVWQPMGDSFAYLGRFVKLPSEVQAWLGFPDQHWLTGKNDRGASFTAIAAIIESEPEGLFSE